jgi:PAS domain S-box-containing protein
MAAIREAVRTKGVFELEHRVRRADGRTGWTLSRAVPLLGENGEITEWIGAASDVTVRKQAEVTLRQSESRLRELADAMPQIVWVTRPDGYHEYYNRRWYEFTGVAEGSTDGEGWNALFHPDDRARAWARWRHSLATGEPYEIEYRLRHHTGEYRWTLGRALPIRDERGRIERWFGTCTDIDAMKRLTAEREHLLEREREARAEAEAANRAKDKFLAVLSHELRTPLSPVVMTIPAMEIDPELPFKFREDLAMVRRNIDLEVKLIDDLLDLSRVTSGKLRLHMQPVRVHELLVHVVRSSQGETSGKRLSIRHELRAANDRLTADPARLQQVFWNLLRNAVKFTPEGGEVIVSTRNAEQNGHLLVEVMDTGVGIPAEILPRVFDAFEQGDARMTRQFGGLGLGLAIAKAVVEMHGGTITAASDGRDRGSTFTVRLDVAAGEAATEPRARGGLVGERQALARPKVLLVEDHPDTARTLARLLQMSGYDVRTAHSVAAALQLAAAQPFDVVVSDIGLPDATGYELMEQIGGRYGIRGIALSGYGMEDDMRKSREAGFVDHVVKPVNVEQLGVVIARVLGAEPGSTC